MYEKQKQRLINVYDLERYAVVKEDGSRYVPWLRIAEVPTAESVVHGKWILELSDEYADHYHCSKCEWQIDLCNEIYEEPKPNYCPQCGAKMDGGAS